MFSKVVKMWKNWSIRWKFLVSFLVVILIISAFNLYLNNNNYAITDQFNDNMMHYNSINQLQQLVTDNKSALDSYLDSIDKEDKDRYETTKAEIQLILEPIYKQHTSMEVYFSVKAIERSTKSYFKYFDQAILEKEEADAKYYEAYYDGLSILQYTNGYIQDLLNQSLDEGTELYNQLVKEADLARSVSALIIIGGFLIALTIGILFSNYLVKPIKHLAKSSMLMAQGDLKVESVAVESGDEIGALAESFNIMSDNIHQYVNDLEEKVEIEKKLHQEELERVRLEQLVKEAKYQALQSQVNPHFLFNTLNTISRTAMFEGAKKSVKLTQALSNLFRYRLSQNKTVVPLSEDLYVVGQYIYLQKVRFGDRLDYIESVDEACKDVLVPVVLLQPIVENAIIHGIEPKVEGGIVRVDVKQVREHDIDMVVIKISDTGNGMTKDQLDKVKGYDTDGRRSIGVGNVYQRFIAAGNEHSKFTISSRLGEGTTVEFRFERGIFDVEA